MRAARLQTGAVEKSLTPISPPVGVPAAKLLLHPNLFWQNELNWQPVVQAQERGIDGSLHVDAWVRLAGRPIELRGESAWISRSDLRTLLTWAGTPGLKLTIWWLGAHYQVVFDAGEDGTRAVESRPVFAYSDITDNELHTGLVLRFLTVE